MNLLPEVASSAGIIVMSSSIGAWVLSKTKLTGPVIMILQGILDLAALNRSK